MIAAASAIPVDRPIVRYHGGKWMLAPWIIEHLPPHRCYVEPYGGGGSVLMRKPRTYAEVYNDLDGEMVNLLTQIRNHPRQLRRLLKWTPFSRTEYRAAFERCDDPMEMARRTIIRSLMGFGSNSINREIKSGFRANSNRSGTTPALDWRNYPRHIHTFARRLLGVVLESKPAADLMPQHDGPETLFYQDPPYVHSTRALVTMHGNHGYAHEMSDDDHRSLAAVNRSLVGMVVISGYPCDLYDVELYPDWFRVERDALGDGACERTEVLWMNAKAWDRLHESRPSLFAGLVL